MPVKIKSSRSLLARATPTPSRRGDLKSSKGGRCQSDELPVVIYSIPHTQPKKSGGLALVFRETKVRQPREVGVGLWSWRRPVVLVACGVDVSATSHLARRGFRSRKGAIYLVPSTSFGILCLDPQGGGSKISRALGLGIRNLGMGEGVCLPRVSYGREDVIDGVCP